MTARRSRPDRGRESGFALYAILVVILFLSVSALAVTARMSDLARSRTRDGALLEAVFAAHGGVEAARAALARDPGWEGTTVAVSRGEVRLEVRSLEGDPTLREVIAIGADRAAGPNSPRARHRVEAILRLREGALPEVISWREGVSSPS